MKHLVFRFFLIQYFGLQLNLFLRKRQILFITSHMLFIYLQINSTDTIGTELNLLQAQNQETQTILSVDSQTADSTILSVLYHQSNLSFTIQNSKIFVLQVF